MELDRIAETSLGDISSLVLSVISGLHRNGHSIAFVGFDSVDKRTKLLKKLTGDLIVMGVIVGLVSGNNIYKIKSSMRTADAKRRFSALVVNAKLKSRVGGDYGAVTLARMIACFPELLAEILYHHQDLPMAIKYASLTALHSEYPAVSRHHAIASIIPSTLDNENIARAFDVIMVPFMMISNVINQKSPAWKKKKNKDKATESSVFLLKSHQSKVITDDERWKLCAKYGITSGRNLTSTWISVSVEASKWLADNYGFNHQSNNLMS